MSLAPHVARRRYAFYRNSFSITPQPSVNDIVAILQRCIEENDLYYFYPHNHIDQLKDIAAHVVETNAVGQLAEKWQVSMDQAAEMSKLALFDLAVLVDNSELEDEEEEGWSKAKQKRIALASRVLVKRLGRILSSIDFAYQLFQVDGGMKLKFFQPDDMNWGPYTSRSHPFMETKEEWVDMLNIGPFFGHSPNNLTWLLEDIMVRPLTTEYGLLRKPILIISIIHREPQIRPPVPEVIQMGRRGALVTPPDQGVATHLLQTVANLKYELAAGYGDGALCFQFTQVGNDKDADAFLSNLHDIGSSVSDITYAFEMDEEKAMTENGINLQPGEWLMKVCLGAIDAKFADKYVANIQPPRRGALLSKLFR